MQFRRGLYAAQGAWRVQTPVTFMARAPSLPAPPEPPPSAPPVLDDVTRATIRGKAARVARRASEIDDLAQDITIHVWERLGRFDPAKADRGVFVRMLVGHAVATVLRDRARRTRRAHESLDAALRHPAGRPPEPVDPSAPGEEVTARALDVEAVLSTLPRKLRRAAEMLKSRSVTAAARRLKLSRAAVYRRLAELREAFAAAGLSDDL